MIETCKNCNEVHLTLQERVVCDDTYRRRREDNTTSGKFSLRPLDFFPVWLKL